MATFTIDTISWRAKEYSYRYDDVWALIFHSCEGKPFGDTPAECNEQNSSLPWLCGTNDVSCDYYVTREGKIYELTSDPNYSYHAGVSSLNGVMYCNTYSKGIELEHHVGSAPYPAIQIDALTWLAKKLINQYAIAKANVETHRKVAANAGRSDRSDPSDWSDSSFYSWRDRLYVTDPLKARTIPAPPNALCYTTEASYQFYNARGGVKYCGLGLRSAYQSTFGNGLSCTITECERIVIKESAQYGVEQSLISEAIARGWIRC